MGELQDVGQSEYTGKKADGAWLRCESKSASHDVTFSDRAAYEEMVKNSELKKEEGEVVLDHRPLAR